MKALKKNEYGNMSIRIVTSDDRQKVFGMFGTIADLLGAGVIETDKPYSDTSRWMYIDINGTFTAIEDSRQAIISRCHSRYPEY